MKVFACPGIDSDVSEYGVFNSDAGRAGGRGFKQKGVPSDWSSRNPVWGLATGRLVGNYAATQSPNVKSLRIRRRGVSPWGGYPHHILKSRYKNDNADSMLNVGGSVDMNPGCSSLIAGGSGAASSMVRTQSKEKRDRGMKLPVLPATLHRKGNASTPMGGTSNAPSAPITPRLMGLPSIVKVKRMAGGK